MMNRNKQITLLLALIIIPPVIIWLSRHFFSPNYVLSSAYKVVFLSPIFFRLFLEKKTFKRALVQNFSIKKFRQNFPVVVLIGIALALIYLLAFFALENRLQIESIVNKLEDVASIGIGNLFLIGLYIIVINSLIEEYFWRGFLFEKLSALINPWAVYALTGVGFSLHHIMFYYDWFSVSIFLLVTSGLVAYAMIMNYIFYRFRDLFSCWLIHAFADSAQIFIAFKIFDLI